jgi:fructose-1,6-bisphosphatase/inositol monophosphatase family enzyme
MEHTDYLAFALDLARDAGAIMKQNFILGMKKEWKNDATPLTETDTKIHTLVCDSILRAFPTHAILSEEDSSKLGAADSEYLWVCDPVDGTHNFSHGIPTATFMLSLVHDGVPIVAVIHDPFMDRLFYAEKGRGAFMNNTQIHVSSAPSLKHTVAALGKVNKQLLAVYGALREERGVRVITGLSVGYVGALVAAGELSACIFSGRDAHDTVAIQLLVEEAGGIATDLTGQKSARYDGEVNGQIASNGLVHADLVEIVSRYEA